MLVLALAAFQPTAPVIRASTAGTTSAAIALVTPSTEPQSGVKSYQLQRSPAGQNAWRLIASGLPASAFPYTDSGLSPGTSYDYQGGSIDNAPQANESPWSATSTMTTVASGGGGGGGSMQQNFGYGIQLTGNLTNQLAQIGELKVGGTLNPSGKTKFVEVPLYWNQMEFGAGGNYSQGSGASAQGTAALDQIDAACKAAGLQWLPLLFFADYDGNVSGDVANFNPCPPDFAYAGAGSGYNASDPDPGYYVAAQNTTYQADGLQSIFNICGPKGWARLTAMLVHYCQRYGGPTISGATNPNFSLHFEGFRLPETANAQFNSVLQDNIFFGINGANQNGGGLAALMAAVRAIAPNIGIWPSTNFVAVSNEGAQFTGLFGACQANAAGCGGPDILYNTTADPSFYQSTDSYTFNGTVGGKNWGGLESPILCRFAETQYGDMKGRPVSDLTLFYDFLFGLNGQGAPDVGGSIFPQYWSIAIGQPNSDGSDNSAWNLSTVAAWINSAPPLNTAVPTSYKAAAPPGGQFDLYIAPGGSPSGAGTLESPYDVTLFNAQPNLYAGKRVGMIGDLGPYNLYAYITSRGALASFNRPALQVNGGAGGKQTYVASCDSSGNYSPRLAVLTSLQNGEYPMLSGSPIECALIGQGSGAAPPNPGNAIIDGLSINGAYQQGICFYYNDNPGGGIGVGATEGGITGIEIRQTEIQAITGTIDDNVGGVFFQGVTGAWVHHNKIHNIQPSAAGQPGANPDDVAAIFDYNSKSNLYEQNTLYDCNNAWFSKAQSNGNHTFRFNYVECAGSSPQNALHGASGGGAGDTNLIYGNILKCPGANLADMSLGGASSLQALGFYSNTSQFGPGQTGVNYPGGRGLSVRHQNNIYIPTVQAEGGEAVMGAGASNLTSDYNNYGGTTGAVIGTTALGNLSFSAAQGAGLDTHSINVAPSFQSTGTATTGGPTAYQLVPGSPGSAGSANPGIDVNTGATIDQGAWGVVSAYSYRGCGF